VKYRKLTQKEYDNLSTYLSDTLYVITEPPDTIVIDGVEIPVTKETKKVIHQMYPELFL